MRTRCIDCGLIYDLSEREPDCPHEELPAEVLAARGTTVRDRYLADVPGPE